MPATFTVTKTADDGTANTLRWAIDQANATPGADRIEFNIGVAGTTQTITLDPMRGTLSAITEAVTIDGTTQAVAGGGVAGVWVGVNGNQLMGGGLRVQAGSVSITGLAIYNFNGDGVFLSNPAGEPGDRLYNCYIGTDVSGRAAGVGNTGEGVYVLGGSNDTIGDDTGTSLTASRGTKASQPR